MRTFLLISTLAVSASAWAEGGVLYIGDSLSNGYLTEVIRDRFVRAFPGSPIRVISVPGSKSRNWRHDPEYSTDWSVHDFWNSGFKKTPKGSTPKLSDLLAKENPRILVIQQGTNDFWGWADKAVPQVQAGNKPIPALDSYEVTGLLAFRDFLVANGFSRDGAKRCVWVAPPDMVKWDVMIRGKRVGHIENAIYHTINGALSETCHVLNGLESTRYPGGGDGVHYPDTPAGKYQREQWVGAIIETAVQAAQ